MVSIVFMIVAIASALGIFGFGIYKVMKLVKSPTPLANNYPLEVKRLAFFSGAIGVATLLIFLFLSIYHKYPLL